MIEIGRFHRFGLGRSRDLDQATRWFQRAADLKDARAQLNLGLLYEDEGRSVEDERRAFHFYQLSAEQGYGEAMFRLYRAYRRGQGVEPNWDEARRWLERSAEAGYAWAQAEFGNYYEKGPYRSYIPNYAELEENIPEAVRWYRRSADQNWAGGLYQLALCYLEGKGVEQDEAYGLELMRRAADQNHRYALYELAGLYATGIGEPRHERETPMQLLQRLAVENHLPARVRTGDGTRSGCGCRVVLQGGPAGRFQLFTG
jgi:TPR repeat protein